MFDISGLGITCANCGAQINELPFEPTKKEDGTYGSLYCRECNRERMKNRRPGGFRGRN